jgi:hypothetical protein
LLDREFNMQIPVIIVLPFLYLLNLSAGGQPLQNIDPAKQRVPPAPVKQEHFHINGGQIEISLSPDKPDIMLGEPAYLSFVVQNRSGQTLQMIVGGDYRNVLGRPESFSVTTIGDDGKEVAQPDAGPGFGGLMGPVSIPPQGSYTFKLFLPDWATFTKRGGYSITARRTLDLSKDGANWIDRDAAGKTSKLSVEASTRIRIIPQDKEKMGEIIDALGAAMLDNDKNDPSPELTSQSLSYIADERVIPYFVKVYDGNPNRKIIAIRALAKFNNETAFRVLKEAMETKVEQITDAGSKGFEADIANNIRLDAARALADSKHPGAIPFLLSHRNDEYYAVRLTIVHVLGEMKPTDKDALPLLREMTRDADKVVSDEVRRYLELFCGTSGANNAACKGP